MDPVINIIHVITGLEQGGAEGALLRITNVLALKGFKQQVVSLTGRGVYADRLENSGIPVDALELSGVAILFKGIPKLIRIFALKQPDIVQTWLYHADLVGLIAARLCSKTNVVWNIRCATLKKGDVPYSTYIMIRLLALISRAPEAIIYNSEAGFLYHNNLGYRSLNHQVIPNGFDLTEWRIDPELRRSFRAEIGAQERDCVVGMVARYHPMKDHSSFLSAAVHVIKKNPRTIFVLSGSEVTWQNPALVEQINNLGISSSIRLLGSRSDVHKFMPGFDCLVLTSISEGFPNVLGEAMASGVPCVATDVGDAQLIVGDTGKIVPQGDIMAIADAILSILVRSPMEKKNLSTKCRARIGNKFEINSVANLYAQLYRKLYEKKN